ncbi:MAG: SIMPL domain-containing protein, partial [Gemmatimonadaceae bacterium]
ASAPTAPPQILVSASGEVHVQPDRATIMFSVETRAQTAALAASENAKRQKSVTEALRRKIGSQDQLTTAGYSVSTDDRYDSGQRKVVGYVARNSVVLETRSIGEVGAFIDAALSNGSNVISGLRFWSSAIDAARRDALTAAVAKARADAEAMARAAGGSLGTLLEIQSLSLGGPIVMEAMAMRSAAPETPITPSEQSVTANITARWIFVSAKD